MKIDTNALIMAQVLGGGGSSVTVEPLAVTANGEYTAPTGKAYSPVTVNVAKPDYLISDGDSVSTFYFNTAYALGTWLATLTYSVLDPNTGLYVCYTGLGYFFGVDLTSGQYALVWNDGVNIVPIYSTVAVPAFGVTEAGWQMASYTPSSSVTVDQDAVISALWTVLDDVVAKDETAFGIELPQLNAPTISLSTMTLSITNPSTNGNFVTGYDIYVDGVQTYSTSNSTYDLSSLTVGTAAITVKAKGNGFRDSAASGSVTFYNYYTVSMYDDDHTTLLQTESVRYGLMPTYLPTKSGYSFEHWNDSNGVEVTSITSNATLYAYYKVASAKFVIEGTNLSVKSDKSYKNWDGTLEYSVNDGATWSTFGASTVVTNNKIWMRGTGNTYLAKQDSNYAYHTLVFSGTNIVCSESIEAMLDYATVANGQHPVMGVNCYRTLFLNCTGLIVPPALPSPTLSNLCYMQMFKGCTGLTTLPKLPATTLSDNCYSAMFQACSGIKLSETQDATYAYPFRIPESGTGTVGYNSLNSMFATTGGSFTGTPVIDTTYYTDHQPV